MFSRSFPWHRKLGHGAIGWLVYRLRLGSAPAVNHQVSTAIQKRRYLVKDYSDPGLVLAQSLIMTMKLVQHRGVRLKRNSILDTWATSAPYVMKQAVTIPIRIHGRSTTRTAYVQVPTTNRRREPDIPTGQARHTAMDHV